MTTNHTPTPWTHRPGHYSGYAYRDTHVIHTAEPQPSNIKGFDPMVEDVCHKVSPEDAEFICLAVNNFDSLLSALENLLEDVEFAQPQIKVGLIGNRQIKKAREAIARAKSTQSLTK